MFCPECGSKNDDDAVFCENCGTKLQSGAKPSAPLPVRKESEPLSKMTKMLIIEAAVMVVCLIACFAVYKKTCSPEKVAEKYIVAKYSQNWGKVYDTLYIKDKDDFTSKEAFATAQAMNVDSEPVSIGIRSVNEMSGDFGGKKRVSVDYWSKDYNDRAEIELQKSGLTWKVVADEYVNTHFAISVPKGAKVLVDKVKVSETMKPTDAVDEMDTYTMDKVFGARHYVEISGKDIEKTQALVSASDEGPVAVEAGYNEKIMERLAGQAAEDLKDILEGASANKRFSDMDVFEDIHKNYKEDAIDEYERLRDYSFKHNDTDYTVKEYKLSQLEADSRAVEGSEEGLLEIKVKGDAYYHGVGTSWSGSPYDDTQTGNCEYYLYYAKDDGEWELSAFNVSDVY